MNTLCLDVGSTNIKGAVINSQGQILKIESIKIDVLRANDGHYINIESLKKAVFTIIERLKSIFVLNYVVVSSLGESFVILDKDDQVISKSMLYTDKRGEIECKELINEFGNEYFNKICGCQLNFSFSLPKMLWIKKHQPQVFDKASKIMLIGDYVSYLITGERIIDYSLASRSALLNINEYAFDKRLCDYLNINQAMLSSPVRSGEIVAKIKPNIIENAYLVSGGHDQLCATIGSGAYQNGMANNGIGTVECITSVYGEVPKNKKFFDSGFTVVPYATEGLFVTYAYNFAGGYSVEWFKNNIVKDKSKEFYSKYVSSMPKDPTNLFFIPHLMGSGTPNMDSNDEGAIINLNSQTTNYDIYKAILEGTSYEMMRNLELLEQSGVLINSLTASGGGANSSEWLQIKSDIYNKPITKLETEECGLIGLAMLANKASGEYNSLMETASVFVKNQDTIYPNQKNTKIYKEKFEIYKNLYSALKKAKGEI